MLLSYIFSQSWHRKKGQREKERVTLYIFSLPLLSLVAQTANISCLSLRVGVEYWQAERGETESELSLWAA